MKVEVDDTLMKIPFSDYFDTDESECEMFFLGTKKKNFGKEEVREYFSILSQDPDFCKAALLASRAIRATGDVQMMPLEDFQALLAAMFTPAGLKIVHEFVVQKLQANDIDLSPTDEISNPNVELQFTNEHGEVILKWSVCCNIIIPFVATYAYVRRLSKRDTDSLMLECFTFILRVMPESQSVNVLQKFDKFIENRIEQTNYSDKIMWNFLKTVGVDSHIIRYDVLNNVVLEIIPKLEQGRNVISFLHTVIKFKLDFVFKTNYLFKYQPVALKSNSSDDDSSPLESIEQALVRRDEGTAILCQVKLEEFILKLRRKFIPEVPKDQIASFASLIRSKGGLTPIQINMVYMFLMKEIRSVKTLKTMDLVSMATIILCMEQWFSRYAYSELPMFLRANLCITTEAPRGVFKKRARSEFIASEAYGELLNAHFKGTLKLFADANVLPEFVASLIVNDFNDYETGEPLHVASETVSQELLMFVNHVIVSNSL